MPYIFGMSLGSWILIALLVLWAFVAIKVYFFGGFKKKKRGARGHRGGGGGCCDTGDPLAQKKTPLTKSVTKTTDAKGSVSKFSESEKESIQKDFQRYCALGKDDVNPSICAACGQCSYPFTERNTLRPIIKPVKTPAKTQQH